ncbi:zinc ribbon domain-containing protein [Oscillatoria salina]|uniref:zinc ribbon domain-containing protein n=1 Tax=Oscillatoria salina TaxID=331517 RepID=UPI0037CB8F8E
MLTYSRIYCAYFCKKKLNQRVHSCPECNFTTNRDVAAAMIVEQKGLIAVGQTVLLPTEEGS